MHGARVVVAGAGLAGLSAAYDLARAGAAVTIIEARDYPGGRVRTIRGFADAQHAELGGEFIEPEHREILQLCDAFQLPIVRVLRNGFTHRFRDPSGAYRLSRTEPWNTLSEALAPLVRRYRRAGGRDSADTVRELSTISLGEWIRSCSDAPTLVPMANALRGFFLADPDELSVLPVVEQLAKGGSPAQTDFSRIDGGNDRLVAALIRATPARVLFGHTLKAVAHAVDRVVAIVTDAAGLTQQIDAQYLVMSLPASTLRTVEIRPALPVDQQHAIARLSYGPATKALVQISTGKFRSRRARAFATDEYLGAFWDATEEQPSGTSILAFLAGGSASGPLRNRAVSRPSEILADLCWLGLDHAPVDAVHVGDWTSDPWARGGYAFFDPGFDPAWRPLLSRRAGRIVFAGEHTSGRWQGYMNGAVETGRRAARELLDELQ